MVGDGGCRKAEGSAAKGRQTVLLGRSSGLLGLSRRWVPVVPCDGQTSARSRFHGPLKFSQLWPKSIRFASDS